MNKIILIGRLTRDPESAYTTNGNAVCKFCLAVDRKFRDKDTGERGCDFFDVTAWRQTAEFCTQYLQKGRKVAVAGPMQSRKYVDKNSNNRVAWEVTADEVEFVEKAPDAANAPAQGGAAQPAARAPQYEGPPPPGDDNDPFADE